MQLFTSPVKLPTFMRVAKLMKNASAVKNAPMSIAAASIQTKTLLVKKPSNTGTVRQKNSVAAMAKNRSKGIRSRAFMVTVALPSLCPAAHMRKTNRKTHSSSETTAKTIIPVRMAYTKSKRLTHIFSSSS